MQSKLSAQQNNGKNSLDRTVTLSVQSNLLPTIILYSISFYSYILESIIIEILIRLLLVICFLIFISFFDF